MAGATGPGRAHGGSAYCPLVRAARLGPVELRTTFPSKARGSEFCVASLRKVGFLDWPGWDRLDDLDRRTGFRRPWTKASIRRTEWLLWLLTVLVALSAITSVLERAWAWAVVSGIVAVGSPFWNRRAIQRIRDRTGLE